MKVLTVVAHPRRASVTFRVAQRFLDGLHAAGHDTTLLDLYRRDFDPVLREPDEPDWGASDQTFTPEVEREMRRLREHDALAFVFPLWWWSVPAILKGYIDRVWNYGFAYGGARLPHERVLWLSLAGAPPHRFEKHGYDGMIEHYFNEGLAHYVGIPKSRVVLLYETIRKKEGAAEAWFDTAFEEGRAFGAPSAG